MPNINVSDSVVASEGGYGLGGYNEDGGEDINLSTTGGILIFVADTVFLHQTPPAFIVASDAVSVSDDATIIGPLLWSSVGSLGSASSKSANQASLVLNTNAVLEAGKVAVVLIAVDNAQTTDGDENAVTGITDTAGNQYFKAREFTNGQGAGQGGACVSVWYTKATAQLNAGQQITATFSNNTLRDASAISAWKFALALDGVVSVENSAILANDGADPGSLDLTVAFGEYLWVRAQAHERPQSDTFTKTVAYQGTFDKNGTTGGGAATNMTVAGEFDIVIGTSNPSNPAWSNAADEASALVAFKLTPSASPSVIDNVALSDEALVLLPKLFVSTDDPITVQDIISVSVAGAAPTISLSTNDGVAITDTIQALLPKLFVSTADLVSVVDEASGALTVQFISIELGEDVAVNENIILRPSHIEINVGDTVFLHQVQPAAIDVADAVALTESLALVGGVTTGILLNVFDDVVVDIPEMHVADAVTLVEFVQIAGTGIDWFSIGSLGSNLSKSADQAALVLSAQTVAPVGSVVVALIAVDNAGTSDGDEGAVTGVTDQAGNIWQKVGEFANTNGAAQAGAVISAWFTRVTAQINVGALITASFSNPTLRDASAMSAWIFGVRSSGSVNVTVFTTRADDNADPGIMDLALPLGEFLWIRGQAHEGPLTDTWVKTIPYDASFDKQGTTGGINNTNMTVVGEFRIFNKPSNPSDPSWTAAADEAAILFALKLSQNLAPSATEDILVAESVAPLLTKLTPSAFDPVISVDFAQFSFGLRAEASDDVTVIDAAQVNVRLFATAVDQIVLADTSALLLSLAVSVHDLVIVADQTALRIAIPLSVFDASTVTDLSVVLLPKLNVSAQDDVVVTDAVAIFAVTGAGVAAGDFVNVVEFTDVSLARLTTDQFDTITAADFSALSVALAVSANDPVTVADQSALSGNIQAEVFEQITAADLSIFVFTPLIIPSGVDSITVADDATVRLPFLAAVIDEPVGASDFAVASVTLRVRGDDDVAIVENVSVAFAVLTDFIESGDGVATLEEIHVHLPLFSHALDALTLSDEAQVFLPYHAAFGFDSVPVQEFLRVVVGDFMDLQEQNDVVSLDDFAEVSFGRSDMIGLILRMDLRADLTSVYNDMAELTLEVMPDE